jgi:ATP/maltotriose-dependent transcriptional regulator MalT
MQGAESVEQRAIRLTPRERQILALLIEGHRKREIATRLLVPKTLVKRHMHDILQKLRGEAPRPRCPQRDPARMVLQ